MVIKVHMLHTTTIYGDQSTHASTTIYSDQSTHASILLPYMVIKVHMAPYIAHAALPSGSHDGYILGCSKLICTNKPILQCEEINYVSSPDTMYRVPPILCIESRYYVSSPDTMYQVPILCIKSRYYVSTQTSTQIEVHLYARTNRPVQC